MEQTWVDDTIFAFVQVIIIPMFWTFVLPFLAHEIFGTGEMQRLRKAMTTYTEEYVGIDDVYSQPGEMTVDINFLVTTQDTNSGEIIHEHRQNQKAQEFYERNGYMPDKVLVPHTVHDAPTDYGWFAKLILRVFVIGTIFIWLGCIYLFFFIPLHHFGWVVCPAWATYCV